ncbi:MAG: DNA replication/repair protein RecF [Halieaceae bacterium]
MALSRLEITGVRNLQAVVSRDLARANLYFGANGSGKTSMLESIHLLGMGRSFRSSQIKSVITHSNEQCTVFGTLTAADGGPGLTLGVSRDRKGALEAKVGGERVGASSELAAALPLQLIHADSFNLLAGGPTHRRQFMDWGVFHVEHGFYSSWQRFQRAIKQRNSLLRRGKINASEIGGWNRELSEAGELIDTARTAYLAQLAPIFDEMITRLSPALESTELRYRRGWEKTVGLNEALEATLDADLQQGFTHVGPQRADIRIVSGGHTAAEVLSRGQQKLVVCALKLAQGQLLTQKRQGECVYLVDDLPAELDAEHCAQVASALHDMQAQVFVTCVDKKEIVAAWPGSAAEDSAMFHVEHGQVTRVD